MTAYRIKQTAMVVVKVDGPEDYAEGEIMRYAMQYGMDGPAIVERHDGKRWKRHAVVVVTPPAAK